MRIKGLMKDYSDQNKYGGGWEEDLEKSIRIYGSITGMCDLIPNDEIKGLNVMLEDDELDYFTNNNSDYRTYEKAIDALQVWYTQYEKILALCTIGTL